MNPRKESDRVGSAVIKMSLHVVLLLYSQLALMYAAPFQSHQPLQLESSQISLQQQLLALQQLQALRQLNLVNSPMLPYSAPPMILILPSALPNTMIDTNNYFKLSHTDKLGNKNQLKNPNNEELDEELDSIIVNAETDVDRNAAVEQSQKAILLLPNRGRISIGGIISTIPFLPIEINVPDTAMWIYNWISSIIAGIGQRWPLKPRPGETPQDANLRVLLKELQTKKQYQAPPFIIMPVEMPIIPGQL
ncbi:uncharacterized protein LOC131854352 [Achroia grisella]|uniref:uncharacterized protein LOC131854352 n=1 Tax=Achroia grisella TaxID=688607 RepID=UPI0027D33D95|nr:uncharacterized protein LOC131854352 [Achroia grisella]